MILLEKDQEKNSLYKSPSRKHEQTDFIVHKLTEYFDCE